MCGVLRLRVLIVGSSVIGARGAAAAPLAHQHYSGTETVSFNECGFTIDAVSTFSGLFILKDGRGGDPTPYVLDNYDATTIYTNADSGASFTITANGLYKDVRLSQVTGTIYRLDAMDVGRPFRVLDSDGNPVVVDRGRLLYSALLDTRGDADLTNDVFSRARSRCWPTTVITPASTSTSVTWQSISSGSAKSTEQIELSRGRRRPGLDLGGQWWRDTGMPELTRPLPPQKGRPRARDVTSPLPVQ